MSDDKKPWRSASEWEMLYNAKDGVKRREYMEFRELIEQLPVTADDVFQEIAAEYETSLEPFCKRLVSQTEASRFDQEVVDELTTDWVAFVNSEDGQSYRGDIKKRVISLIAASDLRATNDQVEALVAFIFVEAGDRLCTRILASYLKNSGIEEAKILEMCPPLSGPTLQKLREQSDIIAPIGEECVRPSAEIVPLNPERGPK